MPPVIHFDYEMSPYGQKTKLLLHTAGIPFKRCDVSPVLPRKELEALGITYRRIPILAIGKDVYCDSSLIFNLILSGQNNLSTKKIPHDAVNDRAWESWGGETFTAILQLAPSALLSDDFVKDREDVFPILGRSDYTQMRQSGIAELRNRMGLVENVLLAQNEGVFIGGEEISVRDMHVIFSIRWGLKNLGAEKEPGLQKEDFPKVWALIDALPAIEPEVMNGDDAVKTVKEAELWAGQVGVEEGDPLGLESGTRVKVESVE